MTNSEHFKLGQGGNYSYMYAVYSGQLHKVCHLQGSHNALKKELLKWTGLISNNKLEMDIHVYFNAIQCTSGGCFVETF